MLFGLNQDKLIPVSFNRGNMEGKTVTIPQNAPIDYQEKDVGKYTMAVAVMMTGLPAHKIRKIEEFGLLKPIRTSSKQRLYSDNDMERLRKISLLEKDRVNLAGIKVILAMQESNSFVEGVNS